MRYRPADIGRLGEHAREQIRLATLAADMQQTMQQPVPAQSKFGNKRVDFDGYQFDSKAECSRYVELKRLHRAGLITELVVHPVFRLEISGFLICKYIADFEYYQDGVRYVVDVKSEPTRKHPVYRLKKRLLFALHGIEITEIMTRTTTAAPRTLPTAKRRPRPSATRFTRLPKPWPISTGHGWPLPA